MIAPAVAIALTALIVVLGLMAALTTVRGSTALRGRPPAGGDAASDFLVASRGVTPLWNAAAISGEYISAAAFLGWAGLLLAHGADVLWLPIGAVGGYVLLLAFVTAPLRRSGAYTISDFAEWRLGSLAVRRLVSVCVCVIGWFYLLPQFQGAGVTLWVLTGAPPWAGWALVVAVAAGLVLSGGMRSITAVQAMQYWVKVCAVAVPAVAVLAVWRLDGARDPAGDGPPKFPRATVVRVQTDVAVRVPADTDVTVHGMLDGRTHRGRPVRLPRGRHTVAEGTELRFPAGAWVPHAERLPIKEDRVWALPFAQGRDHPLFATYSALLGVLLGTMGLPHILMRFYTATCGRAARRTAAMVPVLLALFYLFPVVYGALGRFYTPELLVTGDTDATILMVPQRLVPGTAGALLTGLVAAGAFAAFISTSCGIVVAIAGTVSQRLLRGGVSAFRLGAVFALAVPLGVPLTLASDLGAIGAARLVTLALTVSACSLCPLLLLGIWWRGLTAAGAGAGLLVGGGLAVAAAVTRLFGGPGDGWPAVLLAQPAMVLVPLTFAVMVAGSLLTRRRVPRRADRALARLHLPEEIVNR
ncbi:cation acetate symporter [Actinomadura keratinilytica]|uniref:Cation acetate symporter n=2 Tax=Actinomadura keratinilytica TaxID=547461 RepID=A0ABP6ULE4_9ACTN